VRARGFIPFVTTRAAICFALLLAAFANAEDNSFAARAERAFSAAQKNVRTNQTNVTALLQLARAAFDWAEFADKDDPRASIANIGIDAARAAVERETTNAAAHYWLGMNLGQLARTKSLGALRIVREMEEEFHGASTLDPHTDHAGPDRSLGFLYRDAPGWPTSIGSRKKAREHFEHAIELNPEFPDNHLGLLESFDEWDEAQNFVRQMKITERVLAEAKSKFTGPDWEWSWADWNKRLAKMRSKSASVDKHTPSKGAK
jgi:tetratricopeptide (TPR) repeat protein